MSAAGPTRSVSPRACSGAMNISVPPLGPVMSSDQAWSQPGQAKINQPRPALVVDENIPRLDVLVDHAATVDVPNGPRNLGHQSRCLPRRGKGIPNVVLQCRAATYSITT